MNYTIVVLTRAGTDFDVKKFLKSLKKLPAPDNRTDNNEVSVQETNVTYSEHNQSYPVIKKFLIDDIDSRIMGVNNACKSEFERIGIRNAVIELIDVVQTQQKGKPFSHLYFDKADAKLKERRVEEERAREEFAKDECKRLDRAQEKLDNLLNRYCKHIQRRKLEAVRKRDNLVLTIIDDVKYFKKAIAQVLQALGGTEDFLSPLNWNLTGLVRNRLEILENEAPDWNSTSKQEIEEELNSMEERHDEMKTKDKTLIRDMKKRNLEDEYELILGYMNQVAVFEAESFLNTKPLSDLYKIKLEEFSGNVNDAVKTHIHWTNEQLKMDYSDDQIKDLALSGCGLDEALNHLLRQLEKEEHMASWTGRMKWHITKKVIHQKKKKTQDIGMKTLVEGSAGTSNEEEIYAKQATEYLINRRLSIIRLQTIPETINCQQMLDEIDMDEEKKKKYRRAFDDFPKFHVDKEKPDSTQEIKEQIAEVYRQKLLLGLENNLIKRQELNEEIKIRKKHLEEVRNFYQRKIYDLTYTLADTVRDAVLEYAKLKTKTQLDAIKKKNYEDAAKNLSSKVAKQLPGGARNFFGEDRIGEAIKIYAELDHKVLKEMAQEMKGVCFPADATVVEKTQGQMKICDVRVGDRLLTASTDATLHYEDVFMLGEYLKNFTYRHSIEHSAELWFF